MNQKNGGVPFSGTPPFATKYGYDPDAVAGTGNSKTEEAATSSRASRFSSLLSGSDRLQVDFTILLNLPGSLLVFLHFLFDLLLQRR